MPIRSDEVQALMRKVRIATTPDSDPDYPGAAPADFVRLRMADGSERVTDKVRRASGHADAPLSAEQLWSKYSECAQCAGLPGDVTQRLFDAMQSIDSLAGADDIPTLFL